MQLFQGLAIGDGLCDPETMLNYGDMLLNIGLIDQLDYKGFKGAEDIIRKLIQKKQWLQAFKVWTLSNQCLKMRIRKYIF